MVARREISGSGRSRCFINGNLANLALLRRLGEELIQVHGQQEHQDLVRGARQLELLDAFGALAGQRKSFGALLVRWRECGRRLRELEEELERNRREMELARFQLDEITRAEISPTEEKELAGQLNLLENAEKIGELVAGLLSGIEGEESGPGGVAGELGVLKRQFDTLAAIVEKASPLAEQFDGARFTLEEVASGLREIRGSIDLDPAQLDQVRARLDEYYRLKKKYGATVEEVLAFAAGLEKRLTERESDRGELDKLGRERDEQVQRLSVAAAALTAARKKTAARLEKEITRRLAGLGMAGGRFELEFADARNSGSSGEYLTSGADRVTFLLSTNPGVPLRPLSEVASGGELSRIMLAVKSALAESDTPSTMIFDEVDAGIGGKVAGMVGDYLAEIAGHSQVLVVTHLASIAARADTHLMVEKLSASGRTSTRVRRLETGQRPAEIARMLGGDAESDASLAHARQILERNSP
ncbi:MAG: DNA repair protein RecN [Candidatus Glassbacteria bacterium]